MDKTEPIEQIKVEEPVNETKPLGKFHFFSHKLGLLAILAIVLAIPLTIIMSQQRQNTKQEAAESATQTCKRNSGTCMATKSCKSGYKWNGGYCNTSDSPGLYCCISNKKTTTSKCVSLGGKCEDKNKYTCSEKWQTGLCPGGSNIKCCYGTLKKSQPTPTPKQITPSPTNAPIVEISCLKIGGKCGDPSTNNCLSSKWESGLGCPGNFKCCGGNNTSPKIEPKPICGTIERELKETSAGLYRGKCQSKSSGCALPDDWQYCSSGNVCCNYLIYRNDGERCETDNDCLSKNCLDDICEPKI